VNRAAGDSDRGPAQSAGQQVANQQVAGRQVAGRQVANQQVANQQVANRQVADQFCAGRNFSGRPSSGHQGAAQHPPAAHPDAAPSAHLPGLLRVRELMALMQVGRHLVYRMLLEHPPFAACLVRRSRRLLLFSSERLVERGFIRDPARPERAQTPAPGAPQPAAAPPAAARSDARAQPGMRPGGWVVPPDSRAPR
jgi:hypothetical protein